MRIDACPWEAVQILDKMNMDDLRSISDVYQGTTVSNSLAQAKLEKYGEGMKIFQYRRRQPGVIYTGGPPPPDYDWFFFAESEEEFLTKVFVYQVHDI
jgi:hypothetical protein